MAYSPTAVNATNVQLKQENFIDRLEKKEIIIPLFCPSFTNDNDSMNLRIIAR
jgi:hypothetical protein